MLKGPVFLFSGQGALLPGWLAPFRNLEPLTARLEAADYLATKMKLPSPSAYCFAPYKLDGDVQNSIELLGLFCALVGIAESLVALGIRPRALSAHSFGEYAGLVVSGVLRFAEGFRAIALREKSCPLANSAGYLLAVRASVEQSKNLFKNAEVALCNSVNQTVLAFTWDQLIEAEATLARAGVAFVRLGLPHPFHSKYMKPAERTYSELLKQFPLEAQGPRTPFLSSVTRKWVENIDQIDFLLAKQLTEQVNFIQQLDILEPLATQLIEIGSKPVLASFSKQKIVPFSELLGAAPQRTTELLPAEFSEAKVDGIRKLIARLTGYEIDRIRLEDRIQEDLGIDSLRIMEILVEVAPESNREGLGGAFSVPSTVADLVALAQNQKNPQEGFRRRIPVFQAFSCELESAPLNSDTFENHPWEIWALDRWIETPCFPRHLVIQLQHFSVPALSLFSVIQAAIEKNSSEECNVALCFDSANAELGEALGTFFKSLHKEALIKSLRILAYDSFPQKTELLARIDAEFAYSSQTQVHIRDGLRKVEQLCPTATQPERAFPLRVLFIGAGKGIGESLLRRLPWPKESRVLVWGRSPQPESLNSLGVDVQYASVDICDSYAVEAQISALREFASGHALEVWNAAGYEKSRSFAQKPAEEIRQEWDVKALGASSIAWISRQIELSRVIQFSSVVAKYGNRGQSIYSAANAFAETYLDKQLAAKVPLTILQWPPWNSVGMTSQPTVLLALKASGVSLIEEEKAAELFLSEVLAAPNAKPRRVRILDRHDLPLYEWPLQLGEKFEETAGRPYLHDGKPSFLRLFTRESEPYLWDHCIEGEFVLPAAVGLALLAQAGCALDPNLRGLLNFEISRRVSTPGNALGLKTSFESNQKRPFLVLGNPHGAFRAETWPDAEPGVRPEWPSDYDESFSASLLYGRDRFFHGPAFQLAGEIDAVGKTELFCLALPVAAGLEKLGLGAAPFALDAAFQLMNVAALRDGRSKGLPTGLKSFWFEPSFFSDQPVRIKLSMNAKEKSQESSFTANACFLDSQGRLIATAESLTCHCLSQ